MHVLTILCSGGWMSSNLSEGWRQLGCTVEEFFYGSHMGKSWSSAGLETNHQINLDLLTTAKRLKAEGQLDLIFAVIYDDVLEIETVQQLRKLNVPLINYHVDLVGQWYRVLRTGKYFDRVACAQKDSWDGLRRAQIRPYYLPMAANPPHPSDLTLPPMPFAGVRYLGSPWFYRRQVLADLATHQIPIEIYGHNWLWQTVDPANAQPYRKNLHDMRYYLLPRLQEDGLPNLAATLQRRLRHEMPVGRSIEIPASCIRGAYDLSDFIPLVRGSAINLGFTHFQGTPGTSLERRQVRLREFEISMQGGFYLTQFCPQLDDLFKVGEEMIVWDSLPDLYDKVHYYLNHPSDRQLIAQAARDRCLKDHTWAHRFSRLLQELSLPQPDTISCL